MLKIYIRGEKLPNNIDIIKNVETAFSKLILTGSEAEKKLIQEIESGNYKNKYQYIDRFDNILSLDSMSSGCKAALCVLHYPNKIVSLAECGINAVNAIIKNCMEGNIILNDEEPIFYMNMTIDTQLDGIHFTDSNELNYYLDNRGFYEYEELD